VDPRDQGGRFGQSAGKLFGRDEGDVFIGEVQAGFQVGEQFDQLLAQSAQWVAQSAGQLLQGRLKPARIGCVDHPQYGLGLGKIDPASQKRAQRKLAGLSQARPMGTKSVEHRLEHGRRAEGMDLGHRLSGVAASLGPEIELAGHRAVKTFEVQVCRDHLRPIELPWNGKVGLITAPLQQAQHVRPAQTHNSPRSPAGRRADRSNCVLHRMHRIMPVAF